VRRAKEGAHAYTKRGRGPAGAVDGGHLARRAFATRRTGGVVVFETSSVPMQLVGTSAGMIPGTQLLLLNAPAFSCVS
jgi:hypothetical protein